MSPIRAEKKRQVSRPLSPTHKRRKSAPSIYNQATTDTEEAAQSCTSRSPGWKPAASRLRRAHHSDPPRLVSWEDVPHHINDDTFSIMSQSDIPDLRDPSAESRFFLQSVSRTESLRNGSSDMQQSLTFQDDGDTWNQEDPQSSLLPWNLPFRSRPLPAAEGLTEANAGDSSSLENRPRQPDVCLEFRRSSMDDKTGRKRKKKGGVARRRAVKNGNKLVAESKTSIPLPESSLSATNGKAALQPLDSARSSSLSMEPSALNLGSPLSDLTCSPNMGSPSFLRSPRRKFSYERGFPGFSEEDESFTRSRCPSPSPSLPMEGVLGACSPSIPSKNPDLHISAIRERSLEKFLSEEIGHYQEGEESTASKGCPDWQASTQVLVDSNWEEPGHFYLEQHLSSEEIASLISMEAGPPSSRNSRSESFISWSGFMSSEKEGRTQESSNITLDENLNEDRKSTNALFDNGKNVLPQIEAPGPTIAWPVFWRRARTQASTTQQRVEDSWSLERFPSIATEDLQYSSVAGLRAQSIPTEYLQYGSIADLGLGDAMPRQNLNQGTYQPTRGSGGDARESPHAPQSSCAQGTGGSWSDPNSTASMTGPSNVRVPRSPAQRPRTNSNTSAIDPSLRSGVYHGQIQVTPNTPEPTLDAREGEVGSSPGRGNEGDGREERGSSSKGKQVMRPTQLADSPRCDRPSNGDAAGTSVQPDIQASKLEKDQRNKTTPRSKAQTERAAQDDDSEKKKNKENTRLRQLDGIREWTNSVSERTPPERRSSDEAGCGIFSCFPRFRALCCDRKSDRNAPIRLHQRRDNHHTTSSAQLTTNKVEEHQSSMEEPHIWDCGSTEVADGSPAQQGERDDQVETEPVEHQGEGNGPSQRQPAEHQGHANSPSPVEHPAPAQNVDDSSEEHFPVADNESLTLPLGSSRSQPNPSYYSEDFELPPSPSASV